MTLDGSSLPTVGTRPDQVDLSLDRRNAPSQAEARQPDPGREPGRTHIEARHILLKRSPYVEDEGELIGRDPRKIPLADWTAAGVEPPGVMQAIRAKCLDCCGDQPGEVCAIRREAEEAGSGADIGVRGSACSRNAAVLRGGLG